MSMETYLLELEKEVRASRRTMAAIVHQAGGILSLQDLHRDAIPEVDYSLRVERDEGKRASVFSLADEQNEAAPSEPGFWDDFIVLPCPACDGTGRYPADGVIDGRAMGECAKCGGTGKSEKVLTTP